MGLFCCPASPQPLSRAIYAATANNLLGELSFALVFAFTFFNPSYGESSRAKSDLY